MTDKFWKWFKKKDNVWQNIQYKKSNSYIFISDYSDSNGGLFRITDKKGVVEEQAKPFILTAMIEYMIKKDKDYYMDYYAVKNDINCLFNILVQQIEELEELEELGE